MSDEDFLGCLFGMVVFIAVVVVAPLIYFGVFYDTGRQWYEACWHRQAATTDFSIEPKASDPYEQFRWERCEPTAAKAIYEDGFILVGAPDAATGADAQRLAKACPSRSYMPAGGFHVETLALIKERGGISVFDNFLPASAAIRRVWRAKWPYCDTERSLQQYPKLVEKQPGSFDWEEPCIPCQKYDPAN